MYIVMFFNPTGKKGDIFLILKVFLQPPAKSSGIIKVNAFMCFTA